MRLFCVLLFFLASLIGCDHGLSPPEEPLRGSIQGTVIYAEETGWPPADSLIDLRFVALPFVPQDTLDLFRDLNQMVFSEKLRFNVARDTFFIDEVEARRYVFSGVAQQFSRKVLDWRPVGLYDDTGGIFEVRPNEVTVVTVRVDFQHLPPFPPQSP